MIAYYDIDLERQVLGGIMLAGQTSVACGHRTYDRVAGEGVNAGSFFLWSHEILWLQLTRRREAGDPIDPLSVSLGVEQESRELVGTLGDLLEFNIDTLRARLHSIAYASVVFSNCRHFARELVKVERLRHRQAWDMEAAA